jgi:uncharacterized 2Fe-2S/4Fe-4S cluster protein (DUF4445 family)
MEVEVPWRDFRGQVGCWTIGDVAAVGDYGSGVLDGTVGAARRRVGNLWRSETERSSLRADRGRRSGSAAVPTGEQRALRDLVIAQEDVSDIQPAKGAARTRREMLLGEAGIQG